MKILYYSSHPLLNLSSHAGYATHMREMIQAFRSEGHEVKTLIMGGEKLESDSAIQQLKKTGTFKNRLKKMVPPLIWETLKDYQLMRFDRKAAACLNDLIDEWNPDLIYERCNYLQVSGVLLAVQKGIPHVLEVNAPYVDERIELSGSTIFKRIANRREKMQLEATGTPVVVSSALRNYFVEKHKVDALKFLVVPNAVNEAIQTKEPDPILLEQLKNRSIKTVFGFVGSVFPWHGVDLLTEAFRELADRFPDIGLLIVGDGETLPGIRQKVQQWSCANRIWFTGKLSHEQVFPYLEIMDCTLMVKSNWYGSPVKIFEYGWLRKPIIAPATIPVQDVMEHGKDGLLVQPTLKDVATAMEYFLLHPAEMQQMAANFHSKIRTQHLWRNNVQRVLKFIITP